MPESSPPSNPSPFAPPEPDQPGVHFVTLDYAIKYILRDKANFGILEGLLQCVLGCPVKVQQILESESNAEGLDDKLNRVDLLCSLEPVTREKVVLRKPATAPDDSGLANASETETLEPELVLIEVQLASMIDYFHRLLYGACKLVTQFLAGGDSYHKVRKVFTVTIANFHLGVGLDYVYRGDTRFTGLNKGDTLQLSDNQRKLFDCESVADIFPTHYIFRLKDYHDQAVRTQLEQWVYFFKNAKLPESFDAPGLQEAKKRFDYFYFGPEEKRRYDAYMTARRDSLSVEMTYDIETEMNRRRLEAAEMAMAQAQRTAENEKRAKEEALEELAAMKLRLRSLGIDD